MVMVDLKIRYFWGYLPLLIRCLVFGKLTLMHCVRMHLENYFLLFLTYVLSFKFHVSCLGCEVRGKIICVTLSAYNPFHAKVLILFGPLCVYIW